MKSEPDLMYSQSLLEKYILRRFHSYCGPFGIDNMSRFVGIERTRIFRFKKYGYPLKVYEIEALWEAMTKDMVKEYRWLLKTAKTCVIARRKALNHLWLLTLDQGVLVLNENDIQELLNFAKKLILLKKFQEEKIEQKQYI
jgi:hypothetical protein